MSHFFSKKHVIYSYGLTRLRKLFAKLIKLKKVPPYGLWGFDKSRRIAPKVRHLTGQSARAVILRVWGILGLNVEEVGGRRESQGPTPIIFIRCRTYGAH